MAKQKRQPAPQVSRPTFWESWSPRTQDILIIALLYVVTLLLFREIVFDRAAFATGGDTQPATSYARAGKLIEEQEDVDVLWMPFYFSGMPTFGNVAYIPHDVNYVQKVLANALDLLYLKGPWTWLVVPRVVLVGRPRPAQPYLHAQLRACRPSRHRLPPRLRRRHEQGDLIGGDGGVFKTLDATALPASGGLSATCDPAQSAVAFTNLNHGLGITQFYSGGVFPSGDAFFGGTQDNGTVLGTETDGPDGWVMINGGDGGAVAVNPSDTKILYSEYTGLSIQKSTNGGSSWTAPAGGISADSFLFINPFVMDPGAGGNTGPALRILGIILYCRTGFFKQVYGNIAGRRQRYKSAGNDPTANCLHVFNINRYCRQRGPCKIFA